MYKELCLKAMSEKKNPIYYLLQELKKDCDYFLETGTYLGNTIDTALMLGFEKAISCELNKVRFLHCKNKFLDNKNVFLFEGYSTVCMPEMIKLLNKKALIWLDAHAEGGGVPTIDELKILADCPIKNHTILIDDIPSYFPTINHVNKLKEAILNINSTYKFIDIETNHNTACDVLGAYVP